jgi:hypothetical protein
MRKKDNVEATSVPACSHRTFCKPDFLISAKKPVVSNDILSVIDVNIHRREK